MQGKLTVEQGESPGTVFLIEAGETKVLGSGPPANWVLPDPELAPMHTAVLFAPPNVFQAVDMGANDNGTRVNGQILKPRHPHEIRPRDVVAVGRLKLRVDVVGGTLEPPHRPRAASTLRYAIKVAGASYSIEGELGCGALGRVFAAVRRSDGLPVAIKALHMSVPDGSVDQARFLREGRLAMRIDSPYVIRVLDAGVNKETAYLVMERIEGPSLLDILNEEGPLAVSVVLRYAEHTARALQAAAQAGVVHRDVKPANIILTPDGTAKLGDFGTARALDSTTLLTRPGQGLGSMAYMAPEQVEAASEVDPRADLYALGATLYHLLAGNPPFVFSTLEEIDIVLTQAPPPLREQRPDVSEEVADLVHSLLAKSPDDRPPPWLVVERLEAMRKTLDGE